MHDRESKGSKWSQDFQTIILGKEMGKQIILDRCPEFVFKLILFLFHTVICSYKRLETCLVAFWECYVALTGLSVGTRRRKFHQPSLDEIQQDSDQLTKLPKHLGIVSTDNECVSINELSNIVSWAVAFGVSYVTLFDNIGKYDLNLSLIAYPTID